MKGLRSAWLVLALAGLACSDARQPPQPASFDRPTDVDFVCVRDGDVVQLSQCDDETRTDRALYALVTQSARGEVAAVNLQTDRILDNRRDVPGYTFVPTGELPVAIVISKMHPELTYVASYGSRDVRVMRTKVLLGLSIEAPEAQAPVSLTIGGAGGSFGGTPSDMVLTPDETALLVTLSDVGKIARLPLNGGMVDEAAIDFIDLPVSTPEPPLPLEGDDDYALLCKGYQRPPLPPITARPPAPAGAAPRPIALAVDRSCEGCDADGAGRVLVADEALPVLHVLDLAALSSGGDPLLAPIPTGAPVRDVVVTPRVPSDLVARGEPNPPSTYFVYAIDALDGSVMVLENDAVLAINHDPSGRVDRLPITSRTGAPPPIALALEVMTPSFSATEGPNQYVEFIEPPSGAIVEDVPSCLDDLHTEISPRRLRGVFLSAAMADGTVRVIDVHDMDLQTCRSCDLADGPAAVVVRHNPRLVADFVALDETEREDMRPLATASVLADSSVFSVRNSGSTASPLAPSLACIPCADGFQQAMPDPEDQLGTTDGLTEDDAGTADGDNNLCLQALVCSSADPWASPRALYNASYETLLPNAGSGDGQFVAPGEPGNVTGVLELHSNVPFCARGVLGQDDIGGARDEAMCRQGAAELLGDQLWITSEPLTDQALAALGRSMQERDRCALLRSKLDEDDTARMTLDVIAAFEDRLAVKSKLGGPLRSNNFDWTDLQTCLGDGVVRFAVLSQSSFLVSTGAEGFSHNVIANAQGRCVVDAMTGPSASHRAWTGCQYRDDLIQFELEPFAVQADDDSSAIVKEPGDGKTALLSIELGNTAEQMVMNASQIGFGSVSTLVPARLRYSSADQQLYLVDTYQGGLIPIDLDPFRDTPITSFY